MYTVTQKTSFGSDTCLPRSFFFFVYTEDMNEHRGRGIRVLLADPECQRKTGGDRSFRII